MYVELLSKKLASYLAKPLAILGGVDVAEGPGGVVAGQAIAVGEAVV